MTIDGEYLLQFLFRFQGSVLLKKEILRELQSTIMRKELCQYEADLTDQKTADRI